MKKRKFLTYCNGYEKTSDGKKRTIIDICEKGHLSVSKRCVKHY